jgi:hypothetical protein
MGQGQHVQRDVAVRGQVRLMKARILLIEDNEQNRYLARFLLEQGGHEVLQAETGPLGLEMAAQMQPA